MFRALRFLGLLLLHMLMAIIGSAIAVGAMWKMLPSHSVMGVLWKECAFDIICAAMLGFGMCRVLRTPAAKWVWVLPSVWFAFGFLTRHGDVFGGLIDQRSVLAPPDTKSFFAFTVPLLRSFFYSAGAYISSRLSSSPVTSNPMG
jgi:hypothetical protein